jgi:hypothetical protein
LRSSTLSSDHTSTQRTFTSPSSLHQQTAAPLLTLAFVLTDYLPALSQSNHSPTATTCARYWPCSMFAQASPNVMTRLFRPSPVAYASKRPASSCIPFTASPVPPLLLPPAYLRLSALTNGDTLHPSSHPESSPNPDIRMGYHECQRLAPAAKHMRFDASTACAVFSNCEHPLECY